MTTTERPKGKPGEYIFDYDKGAYVGRLKSDSTEDRRFTREGDCSLMNGIIKATDYVPKNPKSFAETFSEPNSYLLSGFTVVFDCLDLDPEMWVSKAAELADISGDNSIRDILDHISQFPVIEREAKLTSLAWHMLQSTEGTDLISEERFSLYRDKLWKKRTVQSEHQQMLEKINTTNVEPYRVWSAIEKLLTNEKPDWLVFDRLYKCAPERYHILASIQSESRLKSFLATEGFSSLADYLKSKYADSLKAYAEKQKKTVDQKVERWQRDIEVIKGDISNLQDKYNQALDFINNQNV
jgi:hypothetical protein